MPVVFVPESVFVNADDSEFEALSFPDSLGDYPCCQSFCDVFLHPSGCS